jgi:hypothetical protein
VLVGARGRSPTGAPVGSAGGAILAPTQRSSPIAGLSASARPRKAGGYGSAFTRDVVTGCVGRVKTVSVGPDSTT